MKQPKLPLKDHNLLKVYFNGYNDCMRYMIQQGLKDEKILYNMGHKFRWHLWYESHDRSPYKFGMYLVNDGTCTFIAEWNGEQFEGVECECKWMYLPE